MTLKERLDNLLALGAYLSDLDKDEIKAVIQKAKIANGWFTEDNVKLALSSIRDQFLTAESLKAFVSKYHLDDNIIPQKVGLILAGNIPLVGFHDVLCCYISGHHCAVKLSDKDTVLMQFVIDRLVAKDASPSGYIKVVDKLKDFDAAIVTGSNSTATHFEYYFRDVPHIIRRNRNSIAVLHGHETVASLRDLGDDVFSYFGLGCRNVSKIFLPKDYNISTLFEAFDDFKELIHHNKYKNNYDYNLALNLLNKEQFLQSDVLILKEDASIISRIGSLHYEYYDDITELAKWIHVHLDEIQCIVSSKPIAGVEVVGFGQSQCPTIDTYADGMDTMQFLLAL